MVFSVPTIRADPAAAKQAEVPIRVKKRDPTIKKICARSAFPICENLRPTKKRATQYLLPCMVATQYRRASGQKNYLANREFFDRGSPQIGPADRAQIF